MVGFENLLGGRKKTTPSSPFSPSPSSILPSPSCHIIKGLRSAYLTAESPFKKEPKLKGAPAKGKTYERWVIRKLKNKLPAEMFFPSQWIRYEDASGWHYAQPDIFILLPAKILLLEIKRTQTLEAHYQLRGLYKPLLNFLYPDKKVVCVQICKNLRLRPKNEIGCLAEAANPEILYTYHCPGEDVFLFPTERNLNE